MRIFRPLIVLFLLCGSASAQPPLADLHNEHIAANVPAADHFAPLLTRDLLAYFREEVSPGTQSVSWSLLREGPTQSGLAYPKFYLWVVAKDASGGTTAGAARVAAIHRTGFKVTHFLPAAELVEDPGAAGSVFPAPLVPAVLARAGVR
jgi:hypothetical protein